MHKTQGEILSSTIIRKWLNNGNIAKANRFLLQPFSIAGKVQKGYSAKEIAEMLEEDEKEITAIIEEL